MIQLITWTVNTLVFTEYWVYVFSTRGCGNLELNPDPDVLFCVWQMQADLHMRKGLAWSTGKSEVYYLNGILLKLGLKWPHQMFTLAKCLRVTLRNCVNCLLPFWWKIDELCFLKYFQCLNKLWTVGFGKTVLILLDFSGKIFINFLIHNSMIDDSESYIFS